MIIVKDAIDLDKNKAAVNFSASLLVVPAGACEVATYRENQ